MYILLILSTLIAISIVNAVIFCFLLNRKISLKESFKVTAVVSGVNTLIFAGSGGYMASGYFSRRKHISFYRAQSAFFVLEVLAVFIWVVLGIFFGATLAVDIPFILVVIMFFIALIVRRKKHTLASFLKGYIGHFKTLRGRILLVLPFFLLNTILGFVYYFLLFKIFDINIAPLKIVEIVSIGFTLGYLSFSPTGLGIKEATLVLLLADQGVLFFPAISLVILDRTLVTAFWGGLGVISGFDLMKEEIKARLKKTDEAEVLKREEVIKEIKGRSKKKKHGEEDV